MKTINVAAAVIEKEGKILIARRLKGNGAGLYEFPGGKIENNEDGKDAVIREIKEELETDIEVISFLACIEHDYEVFHLKMECYICRLLNENMKLNDHSDIRWIYPDEDAEWLEADRKVIEEYRRYLCS